MHASLNYRTFFCLLVAFFFYSTPLYAESSPITFSLAEAIERGLASNANVHAYASSVDASRMEEKEIRSALLPQIHGSIGKSQLENTGTSENNADYLTQESRTAQFGIDQKIFDAVALYRYLMSDAYTERSALELKKVKQNLVFYIEQEYFLYLKAKEDVKSYQKAIERLEKQLQSAKAFYELQMKPRLHVLQTQSRLAKAQQDLSAALNTVKIQQAQLAYLLNISEETEFELIGELEDFMTPVTQDLQSYVQIAYRFHPDLHIAEKDITISQKQESLAKAELLPTVTASARYIDQDTDYEKENITDISRQYYTLGLNMQWQIFQGGQTYYKFKKQQARTTGARLKLQDMQHSLGSQVKKNYLRTVEGQKQIELSKIYVREAEETYQRAFKRYQLGLGTSIDLLDASAELVEAEVFLSRSRADYLVSFATLLHSTGDIEQLKGLGQSSILR